MHKPKTGKQIVQGMMAEQIIFGGMKFTRAGLLKELRERGYTVEFIDAAVFFPGLFEPVDLSAGTNEPNVVPESFWVDTAPNKLAEFYTSKGVKS